MSFDQVRKRFIVPTVVPLLAIAIAAVVIIAIGETLLALNRPERREIERPELWVAVAVALLILGVCAFLASRPAGSLGKLDQPIAIGSRSINEPAMPPIDVLARRGPLGTFADIQPGFVLYARNGALARAVEVLKNVEEAHGTRRNLIYAQGVHGVEDELWIPAVAVSAVYPETHSVFLAISGDETAALGWNRAPASFSRFPQKEESKIY